MCISNMNAKASQLGCPANDMACLCSNMDYQYGIHDCTQQACPGDKPEHVLQMAMQNCPSSVYSRCPLQPTRLTLTFDLQKVPHLDLDLARKPPSALATMPPRLVLVRALACPCPTP